MPSVVAGLGPGAWAALACVVCLVGVPTPGVPRLDALAGAGRLARASASAACPASMWWSRLAVPGAAAAVVAVLVTGGTALAVAAAALTAVTAVYLRDGRRRRAAALRRGDLRIALRVLVADLEAGARPAAALVAAAASGERYAAVLAAAGSAAARGGDAGAVLAAHADTRAVGVAWQLSERTGLELADVLDRVSLDLAADDEQRRAAAVALAGPRASALLLAGLPLLGLGLGTAMGARPWAVLLGPGLGRGLCCAGVLLEVCGLFWMRRILHRAERP